MTFDIVLAAGGCFVGFAAGVTYTARRTPAILAKLTERELRAVARRTAELRNR